MTDSQVAEAMIPDVALHVYYQSCTSYYMDPPTTCKQDLVTAGNDATECAWKPEDLALECNHRLECTLDTMDMHVCSTRLHSTSMDRHIKLHVRAGHSSAF